MPLVKVLKAGEDSQKRVKAKHVGVASPSTMSARAKVKVVSHIDDDDEITWASSEVAVPATGLPVNLIIGQTGTGKTSVIQMMGGGTPTTTSTFADTKHCSLYMVAHEGKGKEYVFLDTVGLLDTASTNARRGAFITDLVKFVQDNNLNVCRVFVTVPLGGRQMPEMADWIAALLDALGGKDVVSLVAYWLITSWNQDSKFNKKKCDLDKAKTDGTFQTLANMVELGFDVVTHGAENQ